MKCNGRVEGDVSVQEGLSKEGDSVAGHCNQQTGVCKHHCAGSSACNGHSEPSDTAETSVFPLD